MSNLLAAVFAGIAGLAIALLLAGLAISLPLMLIGAVRVLVRREWIPVVYSWRSIRRRARAVVSTFAVLAVVTFVMTVVLMLAAGIQETLRSSGDPRNFKVVRNNALAEWTSWVTQDELEQINVLPGVSTDAAGQPLVSPEAVVLIWAQRAGKSDPDAGANITVRGVTSMGFALHPPRAVQGRVFATGKDEIVIGKALVGRFEGAVLGGQMAIAERTWKVVGVADHGGSALDSEIWGDAEVITATFKTDYSTVTLRLGQESGSSLSAAMAANPRLVQLTAQSETRYWQALSESYVSFVTLLGVAIGVILAFGAILGALNTMYAQVIARQRELGTLRALGFRSRAVVLSVTMESVVIALGAGAMGVTLAALLSRSRFTLTTAQTLSEINYGFHLSPWLVLLCLGFSALMGYAGGVVPALQAARLPLVKAVRAE